MAKESAGTGPNVPHRTVRKIAMEKGADSANFPATPDIDPTHGIPSNLVRGEYSDKAEAGSTTSNSPSAQPQGVPFSTKG